MELELSDTVGSLKQGGDELLLREQQVLRACQAGDFSDYGWLVERHRRLVWAAVDAVVADSGQTEDVVQEVFIRAYEKLPSFRFQSSFSSWLWRLARNQALTRRRSMQRRPRWISLNAQDERGRETSASLVDSGTPEQGYLEAGRAAAVSSLLAELPQHYREVLNLCYIGEHSYEDIARLTGQPLNTVRTHIRRAKQKLAELARQRGWSEEAV